MPVGGLDEVAQVTQTGLLEDAVHKSHSETLISVFYAKEENRANNHVDIWHLLKTSNVHYLSSYDLAYLS